VNTNRSSPALPGARIVVVDDRPANVMVLEHLLAGWHYPNVFGTSAPTQVMGLVERVDPDLVLLDLQMPAPDGFEIMRRLTSRIRGSDQLPVIVLTADISAEARRQALALGARDFLTKPFDPDEVRMRVDNLLELRHAHLQLRDQNLTLEHRVFARTMELEHARAETLERLSLAAEFRDDDTKQHAARVGRTVAVLGEQFRLADEEVARLRCAAPLHDIGKIGVPDSILLKSGRLAPDEFEQMKTHTLIGAEIVSGSSSDILELSAVIARTHHEHWDGRGYPHGIAGDEIPLAGRLSAVADVFDALTHARPYKPAWPVDDAVAEMQRLRGTQFDPEVLDAFSSIDHTGLLEPVTAAASSLAPGAAP
jgi:putative two-component system response regulator